jgi:hypothetical protein
MSDEKRVAAAQALKQFKEASLAKRRAGVWIFPHPEEPGYPVDVTEHVVSLLDMIVMSIEWGSDYWSDDDLPSFIELCNLLKIDTSGMSVG